MTPTREDLADAVIFALRRLGRATEAYEAVWPRSLVLLRAKQVADDELRNLRAELQAYDEARSIQAVMRADRRGPRGRKHGPVVTLTSGEPPRSTPRRVIARIVRIERY
ncbi:MAG: hypothetical protein IMZ67_07255 [Acidobacteria bacterium]|nr:hypothetical protein [Acidobacteriota bacterium]